MPRLFLCLRSFDKFDDCIAQFDQASMKEMFSPRHDQQLRTRFEVVDPGHGFIDVDEFVKIALNDEPRTGRL